MRYVALCGLLGAAACAHGAPILSPPASPASMPVATATVAAASTTTSSSSVASAGASASTVVSAAVAASSPPPPPPNRCETDPAFSQFDFWVGDWAVFDPKGVKQGDNRITKVEGDCLILERWTSVRGNTGQSYNYYDPVTEKWRQVWVSQGMSIDYEGGLRVDGAMALEGEIHYHNGTSFPFRGIWSKQADGSVRQHFEQFDPKRKAWTPWFTGIYRRR